MAGFFSCFIVGNGLCAVPLQSLYIQISISIFHKNSPLYLCIPMKFSGENRIFVEK